MKKYIISTLTVLTFAVYVLYQRMSGTPAILPNNQLSTNATPDVTTSNISGDGGNDNVISNIINSVVGPDDSQPVKTTTTTKKTTPVKTTPVVSKPVSNPTTVAQQGKYKNGNYTGDSSDAYYGNVQVQAVIKNGALSNVVVLDYPQDRSTSIAKNTRAMPILVSEAIQAQSANINTVSGATYSSGAFKQSLSSALSQAIN